MTAEEWTDVAAEKYEDRSGGIELDDGIKYLIEDVVKAAVAEEREKVGEVLDVLHGQGPTVIPHDKAWIHGWQCGVEDADAAIRKGVKP